MNGGEMYEFAAAEALAASSGWRTALAAMAIAAVVVAVAAGVRERRLAPRGWWVLLGLRLAAIAAAAVALVPPERREAVERVEPSRVVLLVDRSASMRLAAAADGPDAPTRADAIERAAVTLRGSLGERHTLVAAAFDDGVEYSADRSAENQADPDADASDSPGATTRLGAALERVLADHAGAPLAAVVLASDGGSNAGPAPDGALALAARRGLPVHTLGAGPLVAPPRVAIRSVAAPSRASVRDPFRVVVTLDAAGLDAPVRATFAVRRVARDAESGTEVLRRELTIERDRAGAYSATIEGLLVESPGLYEGVVALADDAPTPADGTGRVVESSIELVEEPTRVLLAAGGPTRDFHFLRDQLFRDDAFAADVLLQSAAGDVTQDARRVVAALPDRLEGWDGYDALVAIDLDWREVDAAAVGSLAEWVATRGGGVAFFAAGVFTPPCVRAGLPEPVRKLLPVALRDDSIAPSAGAPARDPTAVSLTAEGKSCVFLDASDGAHGWESFEGFYGAPTLGEAKPGASVLARVGDVPLVAEHAYGAGRVAYFGLAETWRLRRVDPAWFTSLHAGLLRRVTAGRLRGADAAGTLLFDRPRYDLGDTLTLRCVARGATEDAPTGGLTARVVVDRGPPREVRLDPVEGQPGVVSGAFRGESEGAYTATVSNGSGVELSAAATVELPSLESQTLVQDAALLRRIAQATGAEYFDVSTLVESSALTGLADAIPSAEQTVVELGPPDARFAERVAGTSLAVMAGALTLEWALRRFWRLA